MPIAPEKIKTLLQEAFPSAEIDVQGDDGVHLSAQVIATEFNGKSRVQQQRMVYAALGDLMDGSNGALHALALQTKPK